MTQTLAQTLTDLASGVLDTAQATPIAVRRIEVALPMEFALRRTGADPAIGMAPPDALQARGLATPLGRFAFTIDIAGGSDG